eukprot:gene18123-biopygen9924
MTDGPWDPSTAVEIRAAGGGGAMNSNVPVPDHTYGCFGCMHVHIYCDLSLCCDAGRQEWLSHPHCCAARRQRHRPAERRTAESRREAHPGRWIWDPQSGGLQEAAVVHVPNKLSVAVVEKRWPVGILLCSSAKPR